MYPNTRAPRCRACGVRGSGQGLPQRLCGMLGAAPGQVLDLLPARDPRRDDVRLGRGRLDGGSQPPVPQADGDVVVLSLEPEGPGHAAATRIDLADLEARPAERRHGGAGPYHGLLVAVPVQKGPPRGRPVLPRDREPAPPLAKQELLEEEAGPGDLTRLIAAHELDPFIPHRE